jgi:hypothetical protein
MAAEEMDWSASARRCGATPSAPAAQLVLPHDRGSGGRVAPVTSLVLPWSYPGLRYGGEGAASGSRLCPRRAGSLGQVAAVSGYLEQARTGEAGNGEARRTANRASAVSAAKWQSSVSSSDDTHKAWSTIGGSCANTRRSGAGTGGCGVTRGVCVSGWSASRQPALGPGPPVRSCGLFAITPRGTGTRFRPRTLGADLETERELLRRLELRIAELERRLQMDNSDSRTPSR